MPRCAPPGRLHEAPRTGEIEQPVHIDIAQAGNSDAPAVIVICPGTRMAEGLCASGLQTTLLRAGHQTELPASIGLVMVHTVMPSEFRSAEWDTSIRKAPSRKNGTIHCLPPQSSALLRNSGKRPRRPRKKPNVKGGAACLTEHRSASFRAPDN